MGRDDKIRTWGLFGHAQLNINDYTKVYSYDVVQLELVFLTVAIIM